MVLAERAAELERALDRGEFFLAYQPLVMVRSGHVSGFEALVRWRHPDHGTLGPERFIGDCEEDPRLIRRLGHWVLEEACRQRRSWLEQGIEQGAVSVNVSPRQLEDPDFDRSVLEVVGGSGLRPSLLELEVTERVFLSEFDQLRDVLLPLRRQGVGLSLDDFGTGYSSLRLLQGLRVDKLKIPIDFIWGLGRDPDCEAILDAIIGLGHRLGHAIVAEGVENKEQFSLLCLRGCDMAQGNYLLAPSSPQTVERWYRRRNGAAATVDRGVFPDSGEERIRVLVVDDQELARQAVVRVLSVAEDLEVVGEAGNGEEALRLVEGTQVDVVILDVSMPVMGGLEALRQLQQRSPRPGVLVLSMHPEDQYAERFLRAGADGYMTKERAAEELVGAVRTVRAGERYVSGAVRQRMEDRSPP